MKKLFFLLIATAVCLLAVTTTRIYTGGTSGPLFQIYPVAVPTSPADVTTSDARIVEVTLTNTTAGALTVTITDKQASPLAFLSAVSVAANSTYVIETPGLRYMPGGITWSASGSGIVGYVSWR